MTRTLRRLALPLLLALLAPPAGAAVPQVLTYAGYLKTAAGAPVTAATDLTFRLYAGASDVTPVWSEQVSVLPSGDGWFSAVLGATTALPAGLTAESLWLGLQVGGDAEFAQRLRLTPSPAALAVDWSGVQGKPSCGAGQFLTLDGGGALGCTAPPAGGLTAVTVGAGLTGQGTPGSPLALVLGAGVVSSPGGVTVDAGPGLAFLPGTGQLALDLPAAGAAAGTSSQAARADHRHRGAPMVQLKPSDFVESSGGATLGRFSLSANSMPFRVVPAMAMPAQATVYAVAQLPAGVALGTTATVHLSVAGETGGDVALNAFGGAFGPPGSDQVGNFSDGRTVTRALAAGSSDVVTLPSFQFYPRTFPSPGSPIVEGPPVPGDLLVLRIDNGNAAGGAPFHLLGVQITFDTP